MPIFTVPTWKDSPDLRGITYTYDGDNVSRVDYSDGSYFTYTYDLDGNLLTKSDGLRTWTFVYVLGVLTNITVI